MQITHKMVSASLPKRQNGVAMIVALLMLLVLTLLGTASARRTVLEERMTGNTQDRNIAFQAAEGALRQAEVDLQAPALPEFKGDDGLYKPAPVDEMPLWETLEWGSDEVIAYEGMEDAPAELEEAEVDYFIEELPNVPGAGGSSLLLGRPADENQIFRITARATGIAGNATVTLQTTYKR